MGAFQDEGVIWSNPRTIWAVTDDDFHAQATEEWIVPFLECSIRHINDNYKINSHHYQAWTRPIMHSCVLCPPLLNWRMNHKYSTSRVMPTSVLSILTCNEAKLFNGQVKRRMGVSGNFSFHFLPQVNRVFPSWYPLTLLSCVGFRSVTFLHYYRLLSQFCNFLRCLVALQISHF